MPSELDFDHDFSGASVAIDPAVAIAAPVSEVDLPLPTLEHGNLIDFDFSVATKSPEPGKTP